MLTLPALAVAAALAGMHSLKRQAYSAAPFTPVPALTVAYHVPPLFSSALLPVLARIVPEGAPCRVIPIFPLSGAEVAETVYSRV